jgi:endonuclease/exonuclease/phosphatase (EEP) superfamily protein YafD
MTLIQLIICGLMIATTRVFAIEANNPIDCRDHIDGIVSLSAAPSSQPREPIEVLVWNVQKFENPKAINWLDQTSAHVIITQESIESTHKQFALSKQAADVFAPGYQTLNNETSGVGIVTRLETLSSCAWQHQEPWLLTPKATLVSAVRAADKIMIIVNLHAVNFSIGTSELNNQLEAISAVIGDFKGPVIVAGDFNTWSQSRTQLLIGFAQEHGLQPAVFEPDYRVKPFSYPLDHILTKNLQVIDSRSEENEFSDHNPLILTIALPTPNDVQLSYKSSTEIKRSFAKR